VRVAGLEMVIVEVGPNRQTKSGERIKSNKRFGYNRSSYDHPPVVRRLPQKFNLENRAQPQVDLNDQNSSLQWNEAMALGF